MLEMFIVLSANVAVIFLFLTCENKGVTKQIG